MGWGFLIEILFAFSGVRPDGSVGFHRFYLSLCKYSEIIPDPNGVKIKLYPIITETYDSWTDTDGTRCMGAPLSMIQPGLKPPPLFLDPPFWKCRRSMQRRSSTDW